VPNGFWYKQKHREYVFFAFLEEFQEDHPDGPYPCYDDYLDNKLSGLLRVYEYSPFEILKGMGFTNPESEHYDWLLDEAPYLLVGMPKNYLDDKEKRTKAVKFMVEHEGEKPEEITYEILKLYGFHGLIKDGYTTFSLLKEAGYVVDPTEMTNAPKAIWNSKKTKCKAIMRLALELDKLPEEISYMDYINGGLLGLISKYHGKLYTLLADSGFCVSKEDRVRVGRDYWGDPEIRIKKTQELAKELDRVPTYRDFQKKMRSALHYKKASELRKEAGLE
jgi:hypothetical protein